MKKITSFVLASAVVAGGLCGVISVANDRKSEVLEVEIKQEVQDILDFEIVDDPATHTHLL